MANHVPQYFTLPLLSSPVLVFLLFPLLLLHVSLCSPSRAIVRYRSVSISTHSINTAPLFSRISVLCSPRLVRFSPSRHFLGNKQKHHEVRFSTRCSRSHFRRRRLCSWRAQSSNASQAHEKGRRRISGWWLTKCNMRVHHVSCDLVWRSNMYVSVCSCYAYAYTDRKRLQWPNQLPQHIRR